MYPLKRLKDLRQNNNLNQAALADLLKITRQQYSLYERGVRTLPVYYLAILANFYHTSTDYILELTDEK